MVIPPALFGLPGFDLQCVVLSFRDSNVVFYGGWWVVGVVAAVLEEEGEEKEQNAITSLINTSQPIWELCLAQF